MTAPRRQARPGPTVVKLGGSLARSAHLSAWLDVVAEHPGPLVLVPGGGPFADLVRDLQKRWRFDDTAADAMAVLAMEQFGRMLAALRPKLRPADSRAAMTRAWRDDEVPVWMPARMAEKDTDRARSWAMTSDSLAARLAGLLAADDLILVKSAAPPPGAAAAQDLATAGLVDRAFPAELGASGARCLILNAGQSAIFRAGTAAALDVGCLVSA